MIRTPAPGVLLLLTVACSGDKAPGTDSGTTPTFPTTPTDFEGFLAVGFGVTAAEFAVDDDGKAGGWTDPSGAQSATVTLRIVDETYTNGANATNHCDFTWGWREPIAPTSSPATSAFARWDVSSDPDAFLTETCSDLEFGPAWDSDVPGMILASTFGVGVGDLDPDVREALKESFGYDFDDLIPYVIGGGYFWDGLRDQDKLEVPDGWRTGFVDTGVIYAFELDASMTAPAGAPVALRADQVISGSTVGRARYEFQGTSLLTPATALVIHALKNQD